MIRILYLADSLAQLMQTEFNALVWRDLRNGRDDNGNLDPSLYGWRMYGDLGMIEGPTIRFPTFYAAKLMSHFARAGDTVVSAASDHLLLSAYAVRRADGALNLLVINKDAAASFTARIAVAGFQAHAMAPALSYGVPQDQAAQSGIGSPDLAPATFTNVSSAFDGVFPPYSATLLVLQPEAPKLSLLSSSTELSSFVPLQLEGQPGVAYELQSSPDLTTWTSVSTNLLAENTLILTNGVIPGAAGQFWRARWRPEPDGSRL